MKLPRILVVDDQIARDETERGLFLKRAQVSEIGAKAEGKALPAIAQIAICSGQRIDVDKVQNDFEVIREAIEHDDWALVFLDARFDSGLLEENGLPVGSPGDDEFGEIVRKRLKAEFPNLPVVMLTSKRHEELTDVGVAYCSKQGFDSRRLREMLLAYGRVSAEQLRLLLSLERETVAEAPATLAAFRQVFVHAPRNITFLILGESGVGKEVLARFSHQQSGRKGAFVGVNLAALSRDLLEAELFGVEKGAATGVGERPGKFELANGGTLFLDEVGDMPLDAQTKILRALQERELIRVGGSRPVSFDVRLVCATSRDLGAMIEGGQFRGDLYYRINTVSVTIPPLRERPAEIGPLALAFVDRFSKEFALTGVSISSEASEVLRAHTYPGNVRELENLVRRLVSGSGNHQLISATEVLEAIGASSAHTAGKATQGEIDSVNVSGRVTEEVARPQSLSEILTFMDSFVIANDDPALNGLLPRFDEAAANFRKRMAGAMLDRWQDPTTREHNRQRAMQLLLGDKSLRGKGPPRLINEILGRKQGDDVSDADLDALIAFWKKSEESHNSK